MTRLLLILSGLLLSISVYALDKISPPTFSAPDKHYVADDPVACEALRFVCADYEITFFNEQGCGCAMPASGRYVSRDTQACLDLEFGCNSQQRRFFNPHGCGCYQPVVTDAQECATAASPTTQSDGE